jgi:hypothetical protein
MLKRIFSLLAVHALCDYPLQGEFLAKGKDPYAPNPGVPWYQCLGAHALIHGGGVFVATGSVGLGIAETIVHAAIDYGKTANKYSFNTDQALHVGCKVLWAAIVELQDNDASFFSYVSQDDEVALDQSQ